MSDSYIGVPYINQVAPKHPKEDFIGSDFGSIVVGSTTHTNAVELGVDVPGSNEENILVVKEDVVQEPGVAYTIHENSSSQPRILKFGSAPSASDSIYIIHRGIGGFNYAPQTGSVDADALSDEMKSYTVDSFTGDGSTTDFTLTATPYSGDSILVAVDGTIQDFGVSDDYTVSGTTLSFNSAPSGSAVIKVRHLGVRGEKRRSPDWEVDTFSGDGSTTTFTLNYTGISSNNAWVYYNGVVMVPTTDYSINTSTGVVTFTFAPTSSSNLMVRYQL